MAVTPKNTTWSAAYQDVGGEGASTLDPNEIGENPLPAEIQEQFNALNQAVTGLLRTKAIGLDRTFNITLEGAASPGHADPSEYIKLTIAKGPSPLTVESVPEPREVEFGVSQDYPELPARP